MLIAINHKGNRIYPEKGKVGNCQFCSEPVRAFCGDINIHHWRHEKLSNCDNWKEHETEWHREWKNEFPKEWQEVLISQNNEVHIADIKTPSGLVLELQNSSISSSTIRIRENFYGNIIWLINAEKFKGNFQIWSVVKSYLRDLEQDYTSYFEYDSFEDSQTVKEQKEKIKALEELKRASEYKLQEVQGDLFKVNFIRDNLEKSIQDYFTYNYFSHSFFGFDNNYKVEYKSLTSEIGKIKIDFKENNEILNKIEKLDICKIERFQNFISYFQTIKSLYILTIWQLRFIQRLLNLNFL